MYISQEKLFGRGVKVCICMYVYIYIYTHTGLYVCIDINIWMSEEKKEWETT